MKTFNAILSAIIALTAAGASHADFMTGKKEHFDVWLRVVRNTIVTGAISEAGDPIDPFHRVFGAEFGEDPKFPYSADEPGFQMIDGTVDPGTLLTVNITDAVTRWNGADGFDATPETITLAFGPDSVTSGDGYVDGFDFAADDQGGFHNHFGITINAGNGPLPGDGVYLLPLSMAGADGSIGESQTFWLVMTLNMGENAHDAAIEWVEMNLVPAPGAGAMLLIAIGVGGRRRRR